MNKYMYIITSINIDPYMYIKYTLYKHKNTYGKLYLNIKK
jgi:hypothetical protein